MKPRATHANFQKGKAVRVSLRDGTVVFGKFEEARARFIVVSGIKYAKCELKSVSIEKTRA